jgi:putative DNA primase/helicase
VSQAEHIARALGGAQKEGRGWRCRCPVHGGHSLSLAEGRGGRLLVKCWGNSCPPGEILRELRRLHLGSRHAAVRTIEHIDAGQSTAWARAIWQRARDARRSPVERYLASRGITIEPPLCLRWLPSCRHPSGVFLPAMIARVDNVDGELIGIQRTYLTCNGRRYDRASLGRISGGAVQLAPAASTLAVAEGIETALSILLATEIPTWAALSTSGLRSLILPACVDTIVIAADNDRNGAGEAAARVAAERWLAEGRNVRLAVPPQPGSDFNNVLLNAGEGDEQGERELDPEPGSQSGQLAGTGSQNHR